MALALILAPLLFALLAVTVPSNARRPSLVVVAGAVNLALVLVAIAGHDEVTAYGRWLWLGPLAKLALGSTSLLFFLCSVYARGYLLQRLERPNRVFCACLLGFLSMLSVIALAQHLGLMWVAVEACTLISAPMIQFTRSKRSLEATWKYMLVGSVGIALALLGSLFLAYSAHAAGIQPSLLLQDMVEHAPLLSKPWLRTAFIMLFIGYGTKMGLAPLHTWKPDAYGEAPGLVGALLAGGLTNCAFIALLRFYKICLAAGDTTFPRNLMLAFGVLSMVVAAVFMVRQRDFKRLLAYSSVEHMGILVLGVGIGGDAVFGSMLHMLNNTCAKGVLFLTAANIHRAYASKHADQVTGALRGVPVSGALFVAGFFAATGSPPFGLFVSELTILRATLASGHWGIFAAFLVTSVVVFVGMGGTVLAVAQGEPAPAVSSTTFRDRFETVAPAFAFLSVLVLLGLYLPKPLEALLRDAAAYVDSR